MSAGLFAFLRRVAFGVAESLCRDSGSLVLLSVTLCLAVIWDCLSVFLS